MSGVTPYCFCQEVDRRQSKGLTTERPVFFSKDYEMERESGQGNVGLHITVPLLLSSSSFTATGHNNLLLAETFYL